MKSMCSKASWLRILKKKTCFQSKYIIWSPLFVIKINPQKVTNWNGTSEKKPQYPYFLSSSSSVTLANKPRLIPPTTKWSNDIMEMKKKNYLEFIRNLLSLSYKKDISHRPKLNSLYIISSVNGSLYSRQSFCHFSSESSRWKCCSNWNLLGCLLPGKTESTSKSSPPTQTFHECFTTAPCKWTVMESENFSWSTEWTDNGEEDEKMERISWRNLIGFRSRFSYLKTERLFQKVYSKVKPPKWYNLKVHKLKLILPFHFCLAKMEDYFPELDSNRTINHNSIFLNWIVS